MPELKVDCEDEVPMLTPYSCLKGECGMCGPEHFLKPLLDCPVINSSETKVKLRVWKENPRKGGRTQIEIDKVEMALSEAVPFAIKHINTASKFVAEDDRTKRAFRVIDLTFDETTRVENADFGAIMKLKRQNTANCSEDNQTVIENVVVLHSPRMVLIVGADGVEQNVRIVTCDYWLFIHEPVDSVHKCNSFAGHHCAEMYRDKYYDEELGSLLKIKRTDRCSAQYMDHKNFFQTASRLSPGKYIHLYAQKSEFGGPHDGNAKRANSFKHNQERQDNYICTGYDLALAMESVGFGKPTQDSNNLEEEKDPKLLEKGTYSANRTFIV